MSRQHLTSADSLPPLKDGTLRVYSMLYCPYAQRARLVLHHKGIEFETVNVSTTDKPSWFLERNPNGTVPVLEQDDKVLYESIPIMDYLDEKYPGPKLTPTDPYIKAKGRIIGEEFGKIMGLHFKFIFTSEGGRPAIIQTLIKKIEAFESYLPGTKFLCGDEVSMADYVCWPGIERLPVLKAFSKIDLITEKRCPKLHAWMSAMKETPGVKATIISAEEHHQFYMTYTSGKVDYDFMLKK